MGSVYILKTFWEEETESIHLFIHSFIYSFTQHLLGNDNRGGTEFDPRPRDQRKQGLYPQEVVLT